jgi:condensin complex subunit 1
MAEQAINTIYLLGEQPDVLCTELIKTFTRRVFAVQPEPQSQQHADSDVEMNDADDTTQQADRRSRAGSVSTMAPATPAANRTTASEQSRDMGNAFHLSQLVFMVGHVALKHIVHLELVEREWKRRKDEAAKGKPLLARLFEVALISTLRSREATCEERQGAGRD